MPRRIWKGFTQVAAAFEETLAAILATEVVCTKSTTRREAPHRGGTENRGGRITMGALNLNPLLNRFNISVCKCPVFF